MNEKQMKAEIKSINFKLKGATDLNSQLMEQLEASNIKKYQDKCEKLKTENEVKKIKKFIFQDLLEMMAQQSESIENLMEKLKTLKHEQQSTKKETPRLLSAIKKNSVSNKENIVSHNQETATKTPKAHRENQLLTAIKQPNNSKKTLTANQFIDSLRTDSTNQKKSLYKKEKSMVALDESENQKNGKDISKKKVNLGRKSTIKYLISGASKRSGNLLGHRVSVGGNVKADIDALKSSKSTKKKLDDVIEDNQ